MTSQQSSNIVFAQEEMIQKQPRGIDSKTQKQGQLFIQCYDEVTGEVACTAGQPCGPFYKDNSIMCKDYRSDLDNEFSKILLENLSKIKKVHNVGTPMKSAGKVRTDNLH